MTRITCHAPGCLAVALVLVSPSGASAQDGAALYRQNCATCHDAGVDRAPGRDALQTMSAERVLTALENGETLLTGTVLDQAALHGLLRKVRDGGMPLVSVMRVKPDPAEASDVKQEMND